MNNRKNNNFMGPLWYIKREVKDEDLYKRLPTTDDSLKEYFNKLKEEKK